MTVQNKATWQTKSRRIRRLALTDDAVRLLEPLREDAKTGMVFETREGNPVVNNVQRDFCAVVKRAGIKRCTIHDLRRTFVSYLAMAGVDEAIVQKLAGHASIMTTLKHYTHIVWDSLRRAQASLPYAELGRPMLTLCGHARNLAPEAKTA